MSLPVDPARYLAFLGVMSVMAVTPGPANLFAIATGMARGKRAALAGVAGMNCATLVWFVAAALGLGALVAAFPLAFHLLSVGGGLYVAWLGIKSIRGANAPAQETDVSGPPSTDPLQGRPAFGGGFTVQIANPKILLFFTAVLPPFVDIHRPLPPQMLMFAAATIGMDVISMSAYGLSGAALADRMNEPKFRRLFGYGVGALLIAAAVLILARSWQHS